MFCLLCEHRKIQQHLICLLLGFRRVRMDCFGYVYFVLYNVLCDFSRCCRDGRHTLTHTHMHLLDMCATPQNKLAENKNVEYTRISKRVVCVLAQSVFLSVQKWQCHRWCVLNICEVVSAYERARATENLLTKT